MELETTTLQSADKPDDKKQFPIMNGNFCRQISFVNQKEIWKYCSELHLQGSPELKGVGSHYQAFF